MSVLIAISSRDFDPTEVAVPWQILQGGGQEIHFATETGEAGRADPLMLSGDGFGILKRAMIAQSGAQQNYRAMLQDKGFQNPMSYEQIKAAQYDGLVLPGGHAKGMIPYLESEILGRVIADFFKLGKPVGAICHGVIAACRARNPDTGKSVLFGRKTTALLKKQEMLAYYLTRSKFGDYYRTYPQTVEDEVLAALASRSDFIYGPAPILRDSIKKLSRGFTVRDGNYLSARWPGDAHKFGTEFLEMAVQAKV